MTPDQAAPLRLVIFDCDGVLIDSEPICDRVVAAELTERGWPITPDECHDRFLGMAFHDMQPVIEAKLGHSLGVTWVDDFVTRLTAVLRAEAVPVPGAPEALDAVAAMNLPYRIASNSSHTEMDAKFARAGLTQRVAGRVHSAVDVIATGGRGKPAPDVFLAAAAAEGVPPRHCLVIEDSLPGARAARAARMDCLGFSPSGDNAAALRAAGATLFHAMSDLPALLRARRRPGSGGRGVAQIHS
jgi:beta-phosphoglucomutase-like phosphatase (HAD superfamily)